MEALANETQSPVVVRRRKGDGTWISPGYRSATTRARWAQLFFGLVALGSLMEVAFLWQGMNLVNRALAGDLVSNSVWASYLKNSTDTDNFYKAAALGLAVVFIAWLSRTVDNVPPLGGGTPHDSPRWAIGWWFVPIAFLLKPYSVVSDAWRRLATSGRKAEGYLVEIWWLTFIASTLLSRYIAIAVESADVDSIGMMYTIGLASGVLAIVAAISGLLVVREIQARSDERAHALGVDTPRSVWPAGILAPSVVGQSRAPQPGSAFCPSCGARRAAPGLFCASCGTSLGEPPASA